MLFVRAYPRETQEMVFDAHDRAFALFKGACGRGIYDNMKTAVETIFVGKRRVDLRGEHSSHGNLFPIQEDIVLTQATPGPGIPFQSMGTIRSFVGESVVPVVANVRGENWLRCIGTGFFVSCTGLLITAAHVIINQSINIPTFFS